MRSRLWVMGGGLLLLALGWWLVDREAGQDRGSSEPLLSQQAPPPSGVTDDPVASLALDRGEALFQTLLLPDGTIGARAGTVRVGLAQVSAEDAASYRAWVDGGAEGAGPSDPAELATVEQWISVPATRRADGAVEVGPFRLPAAHRYDLLAQGDDDLRVYAASFTRATAPVTIVPMLAAGLRIQHEPLASGRAQVLFRRTREQPDAAKWQAVMVQQSPDLLAAFGDEAFTLTAPTQMLAPLPPEPIDVLLLINGIEAERQTVALTAGVVSDVRFDPVAQGVAQGVSVDLRLRFVVRVTGVPIEGLRVIRQGDQGEQLRVSDKAGNVSFPHVDRQQVQRFEVAFPASEGELPVWPESMPLEVSLEAEEGEPHDAPVVERTVELIPLEWLLLRTGSAPNQSARQVGNPYPIFVLQRQQDDEVWLDASSDHFTPIPEGLAVSISAPGRYRVMAALSPWSVHLSTAADTRNSAPDGKYRIDLSPESGHSVELVVQRDGVPLASAPVLFQGPARGLPPRTLTTDAQGRLRLEGVTRDEVVLEVPGNDEVRVDVRGPVGVVDVGAVAEGADSR